MQNHLRQIVVLERLNFQGIQTLIIFCHELKEKSAAKYPSLYHVSKIRMPQFFQPSFIIFGDTQDVN